MSPASNHDYEELRRIFLEAVELKDVAARVGFLEKACGGDAKLREAVQALLDEHEEGGESATTVAAATRDEASMAESREDAMFVPGNVLVDRYRIVSLLGRGGMGEVYRADDLKLEQPVASFEENQRTHLSTIPPALSLSKVEYSSTIPALLNPGTFLGSWRYDPVTDEADDVIN